MSIYHQEDSQTFNIITLGTAALHCNATPPLQLGVIAVVPGIICGTICVSLQADQERHETNRQDHPQLPPYGV